MVDGVDRGSLQGKRVLIVEDEALIAMLFEDMLSDFGCDVVGPAMNVRQALDVAQSAAIDVAALLETRGVPFVFSSGYGANGLPPEWQDRPTLPKPFTSDQVADVLAGLLGS